MCTMRRPWEYAFNKTWTNPCPHEAFALANEASSLHLVAFCVAFHWKSANSRGELLQRQRKELDFDGCLCSERISFSKGKSFGGKQFLLSY